MRIIIDGIDDQLKTNDHEIPVIEILCPKLFRNTIFSLLNDEPSNDLKIFLNEVIHQKKDSIVIDSITSFDSISQKVLKEIYKNLTAEINKDIITKDNLQRSYSNLISEFSKSLSLIDIPLDIDNNLNFEKLFKYLKVDIPFKEDPLDKITAFIDAISKLSIYEIVILVNIKTYLSDTEVLEIYKSALGGNQKILLLENRSQSTLTYEKKLLIDESYYSTLL